MIVPTGTPSRPMTGEDDLNHPPVRLELPQPDPARDLDHAKQQERAEDADREGIPVGGRTGEQDDCPGNGDEEPDPAADELQDRQERDDARTLQAAVGGDEGRAGAPHLAQNPPPSGMAPPHFAQNIRPPD